MYKLIIADDEYRIRFGLESLIDWKTLGFEVTATFEDGDELLSWLEHHRDVDVILTDIQMNRVDGIQVAEAAKRMSPPPRVVFISAYEKLDYALSAIENNVAGYIFKPVDPSKLTKIFSDLKKDLDDEYRIREIKANYSLYQKNISDTKEYFFADLLVNTPTAPKTAHTLFQILYPKLSFEDCICFEAILTLPNYKHFVKKTWQTTSNDLFAALRDSIRLFSGVCEYWMSVKHDGTLILSGIYVPDGSKRPALPVTDAFIRAETERLASALESDYHTPFVITSLRTFQGISELAKSLCSRDQFHNQAISESNLVEQTKEYVRRHIEEDLSLESLAEHFYLSQTYFSRLFKNKSGENLVEFIVHEKMEYAKILLSNPKNKVYEVAERIGYKSVPHFNRQFKNYTGKTPNEFRGKTAD